jgi:hypothetical protein
MDAKAQAQQPAGFVITMIVQNNISRSQDKVFHSDINNNSNVTCGCPGTKADKINLDVFAHESNCWIRKRLLTQRYAIDTSITPEKFNDGYRLGVVLGEEGF